MKTSLPASRDLPTQRHEQIRQNLVRTVERDAGTTTGWRRPVLLAAAMTVAVILLAGVFTWQFGGDGRHFQSTTPQLNVSPQERAMIERECGRSAGEYIKPPTGTIGYQSVGKATLYNLVEHAGERYALLLTGGKTPMVLGCGLAWRDQAATPYTEVAAGKERVVSRWAVPAALSVEYRDAGTWDNRRAALVAGRVTSNITRVTYTVNGKTVDAAVANGTFIARVFEPAGAADKLDSTFGVVRGYDANGKLVSTAQGHYAVNRGCPPGEGCAATMQWPNP